MIRKIQTQEDLQRANRRKQLIIGGMMILLLVVSTAGYALFTASHDQGDSVTEHGREFFRGHGGWITSVDGLDFGFRFLPSQIANVSVIGSFDIAEYNHNTVLYFTSQNEVVSEVVGNIGRFVQRYQEACFNETTCDADLPVKTCADHFITWTPGNDTRVIREVNCVHLSGDPIRAADAFLYKTLKII